MLELLSEAGKKINVITLRHLVAALSLALSYSNSIKCFLPSAFSEQSIAGFLHGECAQFREQPTWVLLSC